MLTCKHLHMAYDQRTPVLQDISFTAEPGKLYVLLGPNGSGKTTLLHCLNRLLTPTQGTIQINGESISDFSQSLLAQKISLIPQERTDTFPFCVLDVVVMGRTPFLHFAQRPRQEDYELASATLETLEISHLALRNFNRISGGERQLVLLARALVQNTDILLLDEPTNHLDFAHQHQLMRQIKTLCQKRNLLAIATMHNPNLASRFADNVFLLRDGRLLAQGPVSDIMTAEQLGELYEIDAVLVHAHDRSRIFLPR